MNWFSKLLSYFSSKRLPADTRVDTPQLRKLLKGIPEDWDREKFVLSGSATLAFRGIRDVKDLDILVHQDLMEDIRNMPMERVGGYETTFAERLAGWDIDVFSRSPRIDLSFDEIKSAADFIDGYYVQSPRHTLAIKALVPTHRDKDRPDMLALAKIIAAEPTAKQPSTYRYL